MGSLSEWHGKRVFLDTNVVIHLVEGFEPCADVLRSLLSALDDKALSVVMSDLTLAEALVKPLAEGRADLVSTYEAFVGPGLGREVISLSREVLRSAAEIRSVAGIRLPDAIQVAAAAAAGCDAFLTRDKGIRGSPMPVVLLDTLAP